MIIRRLVIGCSLLWSIAAPLSAQTRFEAELAMGADSTLTLTPKAPLTAEEVSTFPVDKGYVFRLTCSSPALCKQVTVWDSAAQKDLKAVHARDETAVELHVGRSVRRNPPPVAMTLVVKVGGKATLPVFKIASTGPGTAAPEDGETEPVADLLTASCPDVDWGRDSAFVVTPIATMLHRPEQPINEGSIVRVKVYGAAALLPQLKVSRKSPFRPYRLNNIVSGTIVVPKELELQALTAEDCEVRETELGDFAPGRGEVELAVVTADKGQVTTGSFDFTVHDLYTGAFALGGIRTQVAEPSFQKVFNGSDTVVSVSDNDPRLLYVATYTPFIWGPRDVRVSPAKWWHRVNPMVGIVLNSVPNNGLAGFSVDISNRLYVQFGVHAGRVSKLDPVANVRVGEPFENRGDEVPTVREWQFDWFYGVTVDLEAGVALLKSVFDSATGS